MRRLIIWQLLLIACSLVCCNCAKILGLFHSPSKSHHNLGAVLLQNLASQGHDVTMISNYPLETNMTNYNNILLGDSEKRIKDFDEEFINEISKMSMTEAFSLLLNMVLNQTESVFTDNKVQFLLKSPKYYDVIIMDWFFNEAHLVFGDIFKAPIILVTAFGTSSNVNWVVGNPDFLAYVPVKASTYTNNMNFFERIGNVLQYCFGKLLLYYQINKQQQILHKYFNNPRTIEELTDNVALVLSNDHFSYEQAKPKLPNIIEIGGVHILGPKGLPNDLQVFLDHADNGVIYFNLGSIMDSEFLKKDKFQLLLNIFSKLPFKILMKYGGSAIPNAPKNLKYSKWFPQQEILAHPNVKLFITHGGLFSIIEAIYYAVPIIGIPIFGDQKTNVPRAVSMGYALQVDIDDITEESLILAIDEIINNQKYRENIQKRSILLRNRPIKPIDEAVFWINHVLEYKGANHLQTPALRLYWYQYWLLDIVVFFITLITVPVILICYSIKQIVMRRRRVKLKSN